MGAKRQKIDKVTYRYLAGTWGTHPAHIHTPHSCAGGRAWGAGHRRRRRRWGTHIHIHFGRSESLERTVGDKFWKGESRS